MFSIIDSHIHLYSAETLPRLNWATSLPTDHILNQQSSVREYHLATHRPSHLLGFVFVETDRIYSHEEANGGWDDVLAEVKFLDRIAEGNPESNGAGAGDEGFNLKDANLVLGIIPWAPLPAGPSVLDRYLARVKEVCKGDRTFELVKGFRYLVQDKPQGTMTNAHFIQGVQWLGAKGYVFELGIDTRSGGRWQLTEAVETMDMVFKNENGAKIVINHLCKPNLRLSPEETQKSEEFTRWKDCMRLFARYKTTFMKLSGLFSELPAQDLHEPTSIEQLMERVRPWVKVIFSAFGPSRIMFGSDWPVCSVGGPGIKSWHHWHDLVSAILDEMELSDVEKQQVWSGTAVRAYSLDVVSAHGQNM